MRPARDLISQFEMALAREVTGETSSDFDFFAIRPKREQPLREAAVLLAIDPVRQSLLLTRRTSFLRTHPGQISLPGGRRESTDVSLEQTALREAQEEIGLGPEAVHLVGRLPVHETVSGFVMQPVVGVLTEPVVLQPDPSEVAEVFELPLAFALDLTRYRLEGRVFEGRAVRYYVAPFGPYYIWGATARVLHSFAKALA